MSKYKICVYAISKNEEQFVDRWMDSVGEADLVVVVDTGSTDRTVEKLRARGALVYEESFSPWRFDAARNAALGHVPKDADICVSNDLDEVFNPRWRQVLERAWDPSYTRARYLFTWNYRADGAPAKQYPMEKIHRRHGFRWVRPVHEILEYTGPDEDRTLWVNGLVLNHYPDLSKSRSQYLPLLELSVAENPQDDRAMFWLGREYLYVRSYDRCIETLKRHLLLPSARWDEERCASMRHIATCYEAKGDLSAGRSWLFRAVAECPHLREPYLRLARSAYRTSDWPLVYAMVKKALSITQTSGSYLAEPEVWGPALYDLGAISAFRLGLLTEAKACAVKACELSSADPRLKANLESIENALAQRAERGDVP